MEISVIIGLAGYMVGFNNLDMLAAVVVTLFVLHTGIQLFTRALVSLISKKVSADYSCHATEGGLKLGRPRTAATLVAIFLLAKFPPVFTITCPGPSKPSIAWQQMIFDN
jgi:hypothetical protein